MKNGWLITVAILLPNLLYILFPPQNVPEEDTSGTEKEKKTLKIMFYLERTGQIACAVIPFFYTIPWNFDLSIPGLSIMAGMLMIYYACWMRYLLKGRSYYLFYKPFAGIPLPMALGPSIFFAAASYVVKSIPLALATLCFATGHIYMSYIEYKKSSPQD